MLRPMGVAPITPVEGVAPVPTTINQIDPNTLQHHWFKTQPPQQQQQLPQQQLPNESRDVRLLMERAPPVQALAPAPVPPPPPPMLPEQVLLLQKPFSNVSEASSANPVPSKKSSLNLTELLPYMAMMGLLMAVVTGCAVISILSLIYGLQPRVPTGTIFLYSGNAESLLKTDDQWLFCDGSAVSRITYSALFQVIGTMYGAGNGVDTFNLPDLRNRFPWGSRGAGNTTFVSGGTATNTLTVAQLPSHNHERGSLGTSTDGLHWHSISQSPHSHGGFTNDAQNHANAPNAASGTNIWAFSFMSTHRHPISGDNANIAVQSNGNHFHTITGSTDFTGQGQAIDNMPPYQTVHYIIRI